VNAVEFAYKNKQKYGPIWLDGQNLVYRNFVTDLI